MWMLLVGLVLRVWLLCVFVLSPVAVAAVAFLRRLLRRAGGQRSRCRRALALRTRCRVLRREDLQQAPELDFVRHLLDAVQQVPVPLDVHDQVGREVLHLGHLFRHRDVHVLGADALGRRNHGGVHDLLARVDLRVYQVFQPDRPARREKLGQVQVEGQKRLLGNHGSRPRLDRVGENAVNDAVLEQGRAPLLDPSPVLVDLVPRTSTIVLDMNSSYLFICIVSSTVLLGASVGLRLRPIG
mmetsp:Transcript_8552/g.20745  ORF Transcript_8552/g.20745 Transcript_8552/m.20745 type:complete len:241 (+) Transcript_8552:668-1390(+)